jgi:mRNA-degrading endonuclease RelE of RelBE toxin-antitoxin system
VTPFEVRFTKEARKDIKNLPPRLQNKLKKIIMNQVAVDPGGGKKLVGDLQGLFSVRLTYQDRIVYSVDRKKHIVFVHRARTHYDE